MTGKNKSKNTRNSISGLAALLLGLTTGCNDGIKYYTPDIPKEIIQARYPENFKIEYSRMGYLQNIVYSDSESSNEQAIFTKLDSYLKGLRKSKADVKIEVFDYERLNEKFPILDRNKYESYSLEDRAIYLRNMLGLYMVTTVNPGLANITETGDDYLKIDGDLVAGLVLDSKPYGVVVFVRGE